MADDVTNMPFNHHTGLQSDSHYLIKPMKCRPLQPMIMQHRLSVCNDLCPAQPAARIEVLFRVETPGGPAVNLSPATWCFNYS